MKNTLSGYDGFVKEITGYIPRKRIHTDLMTRITWGTDASFYRLIPEVIVEVSCEEEVTKLLKTATRRRLPVTFRASGTSLCGQGVTNSILIVASHYWEKYQVLDQGKRITLQPGLRGERINQLLRPFGYRLTADPASIRAARIGGMLINNASGMSCGPRNNSDSVLESVRIILGDGTVLDTGNALSRRKFEQSHAGFMRRLQDIQQRILNDLFLPILIRHKYEIKNVTGLNLLPFIRYKDPFDIIAHVMIGSEGTLGFLSQATLKTTPLNNRECSTLVSFSTLREACRCAQKLRAVNPDAVELLDYGALRAVRHTLIAEMTAKLPKGGAALLIRLKDADEIKSKQSVEHVQDIIASCSPLFQIPFTTDAKTCSDLWEVRSGIFPAVGGLHPSQSTVLIEDITFRHEEMADAIPELRALLDRNGYEHAVIYGHALEGNVHFILYQSFQSEEETERYKKLMQDVCDLVIRRFHGSLKGEHGTGRNMAPFVRQEWGDNAFRIMEDIKHLFDPFNILNPGVIFNPDPECHVKQLKPMTSIAHEADRCIECGFCEPNCPTEGLTLSPRQRITLFREIQRLTDAMENTTELHELIENYRYAGINSCAGDGLCAENCPMQINTGSLIRLLRKEINDNSIMNRKFGAWSASHVAQLRKSLQGLLYLADYAHKQMGAPAMLHLTTGLRNLSLGKIPLWNPATPVPLNFTPPHKKVTSREKVVYFPSCINQTFGAHRLAEREPEEPLVDVMTRLLEKAGYEVLYPPHMKELCCGMIWENKGFPDLADEKSKELENALYLVSERGKYPVICDQSPCLQRMQEKFTLLRPYESVEFMYLFLRNKLKFYPKSEKIALHLTCSSRKMGLGKMLYELASLCSTEVFFPEEITCCGFAGDKGFTHPEINSYALRKLKPQLLQEAVAEGYSNSRTCEIGLTSNTGIPYRSIAYLIDECTEEV